MRAAVLQPVSALDRNVAYLATLSEPIGCGMELRMAVAVMPLAPQVSTLIQQWAPVMQVA